jgi:hypothetical protein
MYLYLPTKEQTKSAKDLIGYVYKRPWRIQMFDEHNKKVAGKDKAFVNLWQMVDMIQRQYNELLKKYA